MGKIFYSLSGEGRGHAARVCTLAEELKYDHDITIYAPHMAYDLLHKIYDKSNVTVKRIPGLSFYYKNSGDLSLLKTGYGNMKTLSLYPQLISSLQKDIDKENPDVIITDFEPTLPRAAEKAGREYISINHQDFLCTYDFSDLPLKLRAYAAWMSVFVKGFYSTQKESVVSSFYFPPLKSGIKNVTQTGVFLRPEILNATPTQGEYVVAYMRRTIPENILEAFLGSDVKIKVYGVGEHAPYKNITYHKICREGFIEDLAGSKALISTAGNQLVGEALYLGKPVLAMPETGNNEQEINGYFLQHSGGGESLAMGSLTAQKINSFLDRFDAPSLQFNHKRLNGTPDAIKVIEKYLPKTAVTAVG